MRKKIGNVIVWVLAVLAVGYCMIYFMANRGSHTKPQGQNFLVEEGSVTETSETRAPDEDAEGIFLDIFAGAYAKGLEEYRQVKLFVSGGNAYFFMPSYCDLQDLTISYDETEYSLFINDKETEPGAGFCARSDEVFRITILESGKEEENYQLLVMKSAELPTIFIETANGTMGYIHDKKENYEPGELVCIDKDGNRDCGGVLSKVKMRGNTSLSVPKKSYQIEFAMPQDLLQMGSAVRWILQANVYDHSYMRNKLAYDIVKGMGLDFAVDAEYADVYLNGEYAGNYLICEKVEVGANRVDIGNGEDSEKGVGKGGIVEQDGKRYYDYDIEPVDVTGGYLIEAQNLLVSSDVYRLEDEDCFFTSASGRYEVKYPKEISKNQMDYISGYMQQVEQMLYGCSSDRTYNDLKSFIDIDSFAIMYLADIIINEVDANDYSTFYYKLPEAEGGKLYAGPAWDYDRGFGNEGRNVYINVNGFPNGLCEVLYQNKQFQSKVKDLFNERMLPFAESELELFLEKAPEMLAQSVTMDEIRWKGNEDWLNYSYDSFEAEAAYLKYYYTGRMDIVDSFINEPEAYHVVTFVTPSGRSKSCFIADGEFLTTEILAFMQSELKCDQWAFDNGNIYQQGRPVFTDMVLYGVYVEGE